MTKQEAAAEMIDQAIECWRSEKHACAITLAGAAEGAMPPVRQGWQFELFQAVNVEMTSDRKAAIRSLNVERDWLKHDGPDHPPEMDISMSLIYLVRAISKFKAAFGADNATPNMVQFEKELRDLAAAIVQALRDLGEWLRTVFPARLLPSSPRPPAPRGSG